MAGLHTGCTRSTHELSTSAQFWERFLVALCSQRWTRTHSRVRRAPRGRIPRWSCPSGLCAAPTRPCRGRASPRGSRASCLGMGGREKREDQGTSLVPEHPRACGVVKWRDPKRKIRVSGHFGLDLTLRDTSVWSFQFSTQNGRTLMPRNPPPQKMHEICPQIFLWSTNSSTILWSHGGVSDADQSPLC